MVSKSYTEEEAADAVQEELVANAGFKGRGKGKSKGKGFFTPWNKGKTCGPPGNRPSLEDRKRRLQEIKKRSIGGDQMATSSIAFQRASQRSNEIRRRITL